MATAAVSIGGKEKVELGFFASRGIIFRSRLACSGGGGGFFLQKVFFFSFLVRTTREREKFNQRQKLR